MCIYSFVLIPSKNTPRIKVFENDNCGESETNAPTYITLVELNKTGYSYVCVNLYKDVHSTNTINGTIIQKFIFLTLNYQSIALQGNAPVSQNGGQQSDATGVFFFFFFVFFLRSFVKFFFTFS